MRTRFIIEGELWIVPNALSVECVDPMGWFQQGDILVPLEYVSTTGHVTQRFRCLSKHGICQVRFWAT